LTVLGSQIKNITSISVEHDNAIKVRVLLEGWLSGLSRVSITLENKIGYGSVSGMIDQFRN